MEWTPYKFNNKMMEPALIDFFQRNEILSNRIYIVIMNNIIT